MKTELELSTGPIVVGTDFSPAAQAVIAYAADLAILESRSLHLVHVMQIVSEDSPDLVEVQTDTLQENVTAMAAILKKSGVKADGELVIGTAAHELVHIANRLHASYLVVGSEGHSGLDRLVLGSVAEGVIRKSNRPVLIVGPQAVKQAKKTLPWKHIILACDTAKGVTEAAQLAGSIALSHAARLTIFHVKKDGLDSIPEDQFELMEKMMSREAWLTIKPQCLIRAGDPAKEILRILEDSRADLLILSVQPEGQLSTHLRSGIIAKVLRLARSPVMVLRNLEHRLPHGA